MPLAERYQRTECLYDGRAVTVHRALRASDGASVILKAHKPGAATAFERLEHEHRILARLEVPGVVHALGLVDEGSERALVLEDHGGETLAARLSRGPLPLSEALRIAAEVAAALGHIHRRHVIHKDINPNNLLLDPEGRVLLFDFDIATELPRELQGALTPDRLAGTLPYLSPEQTGRMNRAVDARSDFYALGVTLYQMLTGGLPFPSRDALEIIHGHIAKVPKAPAAIDARVPEAVSAIVMKLLAKNAEDRYQSAEGLLADLAICREALGEGRPIEPFPLGREDSSESLQIPARLYGREAESAALEAAFARARQGAPELVLVTGSSGIGKSSIVRELYRSITATRGRFVAGKFEEQKRDIPYSALADALKDLIRGVLAEPDESLARIRERILDAALGAGRLLTDLIPGLLHVIGPQPPVDELPAAAAKNRFQYVFERFVRVFSGHGEPLVLFLDDLQWADASTLALLAALLSDAQAGALLVIGAYRDNEVHAGHPLLAAVGEVERAGGRVARLALGPITPAQIEALCSDALGLPGAEVRPLAALIAQRTAGNPLFVGELLTALHRRGLIERPPGSRAFRFDLAAIERAPGTENIGQLMAARAASLGQAAREALELAAVIGAQFDREAFARAAGLSPYEAGSALAEALAEGLLLSVGTRERPAYAFLHDRVHETAYAAIPEDARVRAHLRVGRLLLAERRRDDAAPAGDDDGQLFALLHHLNLAAREVRDPDERLRLARLNLAAATRARGAGAFTTAAAYGEAGIAFLPERPWASAYELCFALHLTEAECDYLSGEHARAEQAFARLREHARTDEERVRVYLLVARAREVHRRFGEALALGREALALLGVAIPEAPRLPSVMLELAATRRALRGRGPEEIASLPAARPDPRLRLTLEALAVVAKIAYFPSPLVGAIAALRLFRLALAEGHTRATASALSMYGALLAALGDVATASAYGAAAVALAARFPDAIIEAQVTSMYEATLRPWTAHPRDCLRGLEAARQTALLAGDRLVAGYVPASIGITLLRMGAPLERLKQAGEDGAEFCRKVGLDIGDGMLPYRQIALALQGRTRAYGSLTSDDVDDDRVHAALRAMTSKASLHIYWIYKAMALYVLGLLDEARALLDEARARVDRVLGPMPVVVDFHLFDALVAVASAEGRGRIARERALLRARLAARKLAAFARRAPANVRHKHLLVAAEIAAATGDDRAAIGAYEEAIRLAGERELPHEEAIALERAGEFYRARGAGDLAVGYLARARAAYARWGALAKVARLDQVYPGLAGRAEREAPRAPEGEVATVTVTTTANTSSGALDAPTMMKASQALSGELTLEGLLARLMSIVAENAGAERGALVLERGGAPVVAAGFTAQGGAILPERPTPLAESTEVSQAIVSYVLRTQERVVLADAAAEGAYTKDPHVQRRRARAVICVPLLQQGQARGALYLENNLVAGAFTEGRAELLAVLCAQMAISIDNASLYADLEQKVRERTRALEEAQARVVQLEKEATEVQMAGGFAHEMRNALTGASMVLATLGKAKDGSARAERLKALLREVVDHVPEEPRQRAIAVARAIRGDDQRLEQALSLVERSLARGLGITGSILAYAETSRARPGREVVPLAPLVEGVLAELEPALAEARIAVAVAIPPGCVAAGDAGHFARILRHLLDNARDALAELPEGAERAIAIRAALEAGRVALTVSDSGPGVAPAIQEAIFAPFFSTKPSAGMGLGLGMARKIAALYGGAVELASTSPRGATFRVVLPAG